MRQKEERAENEIWKWRDWIKVTTRVPFSIHVQLLVVRRLRNAASCQHSRQSRKKDKIYDEGTIVTVFWFKNLANKQLPKC